MSSFVKYILSSLSLTVIISVFIVRIFNSFLENILYPILNILIDPNEQICDLNVSFTTGKDGNIKKLQFNPDAKPKNPTYDILIGSFLKELIIWFIAMFMIYFFHTKITKNNQLKTLK